MRTKLTDWVAVIAPAVLIPLVLTLLAIWHGKPGAFVMAFVLLAGALAIVYELFTQKKMSNKKYRFAVGIASAAGFGLVWMNVAVGGILGDNPANMMYFGVVLVGLAGALISRLDAIGMSGTLFAMAFAMALVPVIALKIGTPAFTNGIAAVFGLHAVFALLFFGSALLFQRAAKQI